MNLSTDENGFITFHIPTVPIQTTVGIGGATDEEKNHPRPKEENANFVHQASIVHVTNDYIIH